MKVVANFHAEMILYQEIVNTWLKRWLIYPNSSNIAGDLQGEQIKFPLQSRSWHKNDECDTLGCLTGDWRCDGKSITVLPQNTVQRGVFRVDWYLYTVARWWSKKKCNMQVLRLNTNYL